MKKQVLIVEDDILSGRILESILDNLGIKSLGIISKVEESLLIVKEKMPDLVFMDIELSSSMDGIHTAEIITGLYGIPVIFVSSHNDIKTINRAKKIGVGYITKPFFKLDIEEAVKIIFDKYEMETKYNEHEYFDTRIAVKYNDDIKFIKFDEIIFFEALGHMISIYTIDDVYKIRNSLKKIMESDKGKLFFRCHKSFLVNTKKIEGLIKDENYNYKIKFKEKNIQIPISKDKIKILRKHNI